MTARSLCSSRTGRRIERLSSASRSVSSHSPEVTGVASRASRRVLQTPASAHAPSTAAAKPHNARRVGFQPPAARAVVPAGSAGTAARRSPPAGAPSAADTRVPGTSTRSLPAAGAADDSGPSRGTGASAAGSLASWAASAVLSTVARDGNASAIACGTGTATRGSTAPTSGRTSAPPSASAQTRCRVAAARWRMVSAMSAATPSNAVVRTAVSVSVEIQSALIVHRPSWRARSIRSRNRSRSASDRLD